MLADTVLSVSSEASGLPEVTLVNAFDEPFNNAVATARTCYNSRIITAADVARDERARSQRDAIAASTYAAGHHTTLQHATFQFAISRVSRQLLWSFLHAHPFYNSEQVSQRYVTVKKESAFVPAGLDAVGTSLYRAALAEQTEAYRDLCELLYAPAAEAYFQIFPARRKQADLWRSAIRKRAQEAARYALPIATHAHLYHTISGLTLHRYRRACMAIDVPEEARALVDAMVAAVNAHDPLFLRDAEDPVPLEDTHEFRVLAGLGQTKLNQHAKHFVSEFDRELEGKFAALADYNVHAEKTLARSVRAVLGIGPDQMDDSAAIDVVLSPAQNPTLTGALNMAAHGKLSRALGHVHYSFAKKLSHSADSQDQRHRLTPGTRPLLHAHYVPGEPDVMVPTLIEQTPEALARIHASFQHAWGTIDRLIDRGLKPSDAMYLLPNAVTVRFYASGSLLGWHHKWTSRLCYNAQEEIWRASLDEVSAVAALHPRIAKYMLPPCGVRNLGRVRPICPEGSRYCGVPVWKLARDAYKRVI